MSQSTLDRIRAALLAASAAWRGCGRPGDALTALPAELEHRVLEGHGADAVLQAACEALCATGMAAAWAATVDSDGGLRRCAAAGDWTGGEPGQDVVRQAAASGRTQWTPPLLSVPLPAGGEAVGVLVVRLEHCGDQARRVELLAPRLGAAVRLADDQRRLRLLGAAIAAAANAVLVADGEGRVEWVNDAFCRLSGRSRGEIVGRPTPLLREGRHSASYYDSLWRALSAGQVWRGEVVERRRDGTPYTVEQTVTPMRGSDGEVAHLVIVHEDVTERRRAEERIRYLSSHDGLTALPNRNLFRDRLEEAAAAASDAGTGLAVFFLDLEHFSRINDAMGHDVGDRLLKSVVERIEAAATDAHTIARIGGDEFAVIEETAEGEDAAAELAVRMVEAVTRPYVFDGHEIHVGASVGIVLHPQDGEDADELIRNADVAMYRAIREAPNGYRFFSTEANAEVRARLGLERDLRRALGLRQFVLLYQPQLCARTGRIMALEALLRWEHPELGLVSPGCFIPIAEQTGQILPIGDWVLREACAQIRRWQNAGVPVVPVAVNLSAAQLREPGFADKVSAVLAEERVDPALLELELTESMVMHGEGAVGVLRDIEGAGVRLAIDDFGTGYSSLAYLKRFPVNKLKIDRSFVSEIEHGGQDAEIARAIISLGHSLGLKVVSEGVETEAQLEYLRAEGCDQIQGFLFARPLDPAAAAALLRAKPFEQPLQT